MIRYFSDIKEFQVELFVDRNGRCPFENWFANIRDQRTRAVVKSRINRLRLGNFGDCKKLLPGIFELRVDFGPGYRIYFSMISKNVVLIISGGAKKTQIRDIEQARKYWLEYRS